MAREFPDCPFESYADDAVVHCTSQARARQVLAALEQRIKDVGLELHPDKTRIVYCRDWHRREPWDGPVSFDFLGYAFRPRYTMGKNGRFTGFDLAVSAQAVKRMNKAVSGWHFRTGSRTSPGNSSRRWIGPVIRGWMAYYGRYRHSELRPAARPDQLPHPAVDQAQVPAAAGLQGHEARLGTGSPPRCRGCCPTGGG